MAGPAHGTPLPAATSVRLPALAKEPRHALQRSATAATPNTASIEGKRALGRTSTGNHVSFGEMPEPRGNGREVRSKPKDLKPKRETWEKRGFDLTTSKTGCGVDKPAHTYALKRAHGRTATSAVAPDGADALHGAGSPLRKEPAFPLDPRGAFLVRWTFLTSLLLVYTALITPYEVAFVSEPVSSVDVSTGDLILWWVNLVLDLCFMVDVLLNFCTAYYDSASDTWVALWSPVIMHYVRGWFVVDIVSGLPIGLIKGPPGSKVPPAIAQLGIVKLVKLLRLAKLLRMLRAGRNLQKLESVFDVNYDMLRLTKFGLGILVYVHWEACLWRFVAGDSWQDETNWISEIQANLDRPLSNVEIWVSAVHLTWTGSLVCVTLEERWVMVASVFMHTSLVAFLIGEVSDIIGNLNEEQSKFNRFMQQLNEFMREKELDHKLRVRLREYYRYRYNTEVVNGSSGRMAALLKDLSPKLRKEVAYSINRDWVEGVGILQGLEQEVLVEIALRMDTVTFAPQEYVFRASEIADCLYVVQRGVIAVRGRICTKGKLFGERAFLGVGQPRGYDAVTLTYALVYRLDSLMMQNLLKRFPKSYKLLRRGIIKQLMCSVFVQYAAAMKRRRALPEDERGLAKISRSFTLGGSKSSQSFFDFLAWLGSLELSDSESVNAKARMIQTCWCKHILRLAGSKFHPRGKVYAQILRMSGRKRRANSIKRSDSTTQAATEHVVDAASSSDEDISDASRELNYMRRVNHSMRKRLKSLNEMVQRTESREAEMHQALNRIVAALALVQGPSSESDPRGEEAAPPADAGGSAAVPDAMS